MLQLPSYAVEVRCVSGAPLLGVLQCAALVGASLDNTVINAVKALPLNPSWTPTQ